MSRRLICVLMGLCLGSVLHAQALRDPTQPPAGATPAAGGALQTAESLPDEGVAVVVRDGKPFLVSGTRLYGVGQKLGAHRIERITETEVWLRKGSELRKQPRFAGITRKVSGPVSECIPSPASVKSAKPSKTTSSTSPTVAPCAGAQP